MLNQKKITIITPQDPHCPLWAVEVSPFLVPLFSRSYFTVERLNRYKTSYVYITPIIKKPGSVSTDVRSLQAYFQLTDRIKATRTVPRQASSKPSQIQRLYSDRQSAHRSGFSTQTSACCPTS